MARPRKQAIEPLQTFTHNRSETPSADDRAALAQRLTELYNRVQTDAAQERREKLLSWSQWAP